MDNNLYKVVERITGALSLIGLGIIFILNTTGVVPWGVWGYMISIIFLIWPVFLIIAGLNIIFGNSNVSKTVLNVLWFLFFLGFWIFILFSYPESKLYNPSFENLINLPARERVEETQEILMSNYSNDLNEVNYTYTITAGDLNINDSKESSSFINLNSKFYENHGEPNLESSESNNSLDINLSQDFSNNFLFFRRDGLEYNATINNNSTNSDIILNLTAGRATLNLDEVSIRNISTNMTAGSVFLNISRDADLNQLDIDITAGDFNFNLDKEYSLIITNDSTAGNVKLNNTIIKEGRSDFSGKISDILVININQTAGNVNITTN